MEIEDTTEATAASINLNITDETNDPYKTKNPESIGYLISWLFASAEYIVIFILLLTLLLNFIFFESKGDVAKQSKSEKDEEVMEKKTEMKDLTLDNINITVANMSLQQRKTLPSIQQSAVFPLSGVGGEWIETNMEYVNKEVQTDEKYLDVDDVNNEDSSSNNSKVVRSIEDCLEIYKSQVRNLTACR